MNTLCKELELEIPIIKAPMAGGCDTPELMASVSNNGAFSILGAAYMHADAIEQHCHQYHQLSERPFGINLFAPEKLPPAPSAKQNQNASASISPLYHQLKTAPAKSEPFVGFDFDQQLDACLESGARVLSFTFGLVPKKIIIAARLKQMLIIGTATTVAEAKALQELGVDAIMAQGSEAGGHRGTFPGLTDKETLSSALGCHTLTCQISQALPLPVISAGGIMNGQGVKAALISGASAVAMGTAFMSCHESGIPQAYKQALLRAQGEDTSLTRAFSGRFARGIRNLAMDILDKDPQTILPFPYQNNLTRPLRAHAAKVNNADFLSLWAGQGVALSKSCSVAELMERLKIELSE